MLSAHQYGQSRRVDLNKFGHKVYQVMSDYQGRRQSFVTAAPARAAERETIGVGWIRLIKFDLSGEQASVRVSTLRAEERRVGKECVSRCRLRWCVIHEERMTKEINMMTSQHRKMRISKMYSNQ